MLLCVYVAILSHSHGVHLFDVCCFNFNQVAALSGDARRALDICRRATELAEAGTQLVGMTHVNAALQEMFSSPKMVAMRLVHADCFGCLSVL